MWKPSKKDADYCRSFLESVATIDEKSKDAIKKIKFLKDLKKIVSCFEKKVEVKADTYKKAIKTQDRAAMSKFLTDSLREFGIKIGKGTAIVDCNITDVTVLEKIMNILGKNMKKGVKVDTDMPVMKLYVYSHRPAELHLLKDVFTPAKAAATKDKITKILVEKGEEGGEWFHDDSGSGSIVKQIVEKILQDEIDERFERLFPNKGKYPDLHDITLKCLKTAVNIYTTIGKDVLMASKAFKERDTFQSMRDAIKYASKQAHNDPTLALQELENMIARNTKKETTTTKKKGK